ncbi:hypothetical protein [Planotetraspora silvatica]|nr:hypothetical protein [Planotetraspora silvatica]
MSMTVERGGRLNWAQREWFEDLGADSDSEWSFEANFSAVLPGHDLTQADVTAGIADLLVRHEGLRSLIVRASRQDVCPVGEGLAEVIRVVPDDPAGEAFQAATRTSFRLHEQWPVLFVLLTTGGRVRRIGVVVDHSAVDGWGMRVLCRDLERAIKARAKGREPFGGPLESVEQPLDTALWEEGPGGTRYQERARTHWRRQLVTLRDSLGDWSPKAVKRDDFPVLHTCRLASRRAAEAAETIAATAGTSVSTGYLLAFGAAVCEAEEAPAAGVFALSANRLSAGLQGSVRKAVMPVPVVVPGPRAGAYRERLAVCAARQLQGHRFANFDPGVAGPLEDDVLGSLRGTGASSARFNYIDNALVGSAANSRSWGRDSFPFGDPAHQGVVRFSPPRPGGSRYILTVQHRVSGALLTLAWHEDTGWGDVAAAMLWHIENVMVWAASSQDGPPPEFGRTN